mmetsp:Transcript_8608/g.15568  ORF Transcript_8608/g.15568 Transcript_8608/m.15568 type:complete len:157 (-) Transcript_8608:816-1286(-)
MGQCFSAVFFNTRFPHGLLDDEYHEPQQQTLSSSQHYTQEHPPPSSFIIDMSSTELQTESLTSQQVSSKKTMDFEPGSRTPPLPPPLVPDKHFVYDLCEGEEEDICVTCLEEYTETNPRMVSECGHEFHLACIYEWLERNPHCPVCAAKMKFKEYN